MTEAANRPKEKIKERIGHRHGVFGQALTTKIPAPLKDSSQQDCCLKASSWHEVDSEKLESKMPKTRSPCPSSMHSHHGGQGVSNVQCSKGTVSKFAACVPIALRCHTVPSMVVEKNEHTMIT